MRPFRFFAIVLLLLCPLPARAQQPSSTAANGNATPALTGTVVSSGPRTLVVRTEDGQYIVVLMNRETVRPKAIAVGARVRIDSTAYDEGGEGARSATRIVVTNAPAAQSADTDNTAVIPPNVQRLERDISRNFRRYRAGVRAGVALDPELISLGVHATIGPVFTRRLQFRPNVEFAYGELTTLFAVNLEGIYRLTDTMPRDRWSPYAGGGPTLGFSHRGFSTPEGSDRSFDFGDFSFNGGLNLLAGLEKPNGVFIELKATVYTDPHLRLLFGITF
jgi:hypothetical protein